MDMKYCDDCDRTCTIVQLETRNEDGSLDYKWMLVPYEMGRPSPRIAGVIITMLRHKPCDCWRCYFNKYHGEDEDKAVKDKAVNGDVLDEIELQRNCPYYAERLVEELNR